MEIEPDNNSRWDQLQQHRPWALYLATHQHRKYQLCTYNPIYEPEDIVHEIFEGLIQGRLSWPEGVPTQKILYVNIISKCYKLRQRKEHVSYHTALTALQSTRSRIAETSLLERNPIIEEIKTLVKDDHVLCAMLDIYELDPDEKPNQIAYLLDLPINEIYNARKRLKRIAKSLRNNQKSAKDEPREDL